MVNRLKIEGPAISHIIFDSWHVLFIKFAAFDSPFSSKTVSCVCKRGSFGVVEFVLLLSDNITANFDIVELNILYIGRPAVHRQKLTGKY